MTTERRPDESTAEWSARLIRETTKPEAPSFAADLVPEVDLFTPTPEALEIDAVLNAVDIVTAYTRWCHKSEPRPGSKREGIKVSCPNPEHPDTHPSAWLNLDKGNGGVGTCGSCSIGFDKYDIYAWSVGLAVPGYKTHFADVKKAMALDLGYTVTSGAGRIYAVPPPPVPVEPVDDGVGEGPGAVDDAVAPVIALHPTKAEIAAMAADDFTPPSFDWRELPAITPNSFLHKWLTITSQGEEPEEYYTWLGCQALGLAVGNGVRLASNRPYRANLMLCLVGPPAVGKTVAIGEMMSLLHLALPFKAEAGNNGVLLAPRIASGEALVDVLAVMVDDPATEGKVQAPVRGLVSDAELSALMMRANRTGNTLKENMQDFYDSTMPVSIFSRTSGRREVKEHFVSFVTSTQHDRLQDLLRSQDEASGFISRWMFAYGAAKPRSPRRTLVLDTSPCVDSLRAVRAWSSVNRVVDFHTPRTEARWDRFFAHVLDPIISSAETASLVRLDLLCRKILLLFAINDHSTSVTIEHIQSLELLWPYLLSGHSHVHDAVTIDALSLLMDRIEIFVSRFHDMRSQWPTRRDMSRGFSKRRKDFDYALEGLLRDGRLIEVLQKPAAGGRPTTRYRTTTGDDPTTVLVVP